MTDDKNLGGRPTKYSNELRDAICNRLASGETLRSICRDDGMPERQTVFNWLHSNIGLRKDEVTGDILEQGFFDHYTRAREIGCDEIHDETIEISDDGTNDYVEKLKKNGEVTVLFDKEAVMRSKLRVDTRMRYLENMQPKKFGRNSTVNNQTLDKNGEPTDPVGTEINIHTREIADNAYEMFKDEAEEAKNGEESS